ncbi:MAG TPA: response regulator, partial [Polyangiaceae bacterium]|nr:response regulator [Polyangiaceae bacterium]
MVDDEPYNLEAFQRAFDKHFDITAAGSANEALRALAEREYDAVISDFAMPGSDGVALLERVARTHPQTARVLLTAYDQLPSVQASRQAGTTQALLMKPWNEEAVVHWVTNLCRLASLRRSIKAMRKPGGPTLPCRANPPGGPTSSVVGAQNLQVSALLRPS